MVKTGWFSMVPSTSDELNSPCGIQTLAERVTWHADGVGANVLQWESRVVISPSGAEVRSGWRQRCFPETLLADRVTCTGRPRELTMNGRLSETDCMEPIVNRMHAIPIPYWFQYEKCKKKSWELQAYTYTAFVAPLQLSRWYFISRPRLTLGEIK